MILLLPRDATRVIPEIAIIDHRASSLAPTEAAERGGLKTLCSERAWREQKPCLPPCGHPLIDTLRPQSTHRGPWWSRLVLWLPASLARCPEHSSPDRNPCSWPEITACQTFLLFQFMIYMDIIFFLSFSSTGLLFFFQKPGKGYIFLHKHHFISGPENNPKVTELKFFMVFKRVCITVSMWEGCERCHLKMIDWESYFWIPVTHKDWRKHLFGDCFISFPLNFAHSRLKQHS